MNQRKPWIVERQIFRAELVGGQPVQKCRANANVAMRFDGHVRRAENVPEQTVGGRASETPEIATLEATVLVVHAADRGNRAQQYAARFQQASRMMNRGFDVVDDVKRLRQDETVKLVAGNSVSLRQIHNQRRALIRAVDIEDFTLPHERPAKCPGIVRVLDLQHATLDSRAVPVEKLMDVVTIDWQAAVGTPDIAER